MSATYEGDSAAALPRTTPRPRSSRGLTGISGSSRTRIRLAGASFQRRDGSMGSASAKAITGDSGYFWFFEEDNVEVVVKVLDGCSANGMSWVFAAGLTNAETRLTVTDTRRAPRRPTRARPERPSSPSRTRARFHVREGGRYGSRTGLCP